MDLIVADETKKDICFFEPYSFDMAFGKDENDFECVVDINESVLKQGYYIYSPDNEVGGIVDSIKVSTDKEQITYSGRTWHGVLQNKVFCPLVNNDYLYLSGEANSVINYCLDLFGLKDLFTVSNKNSGINIKRYQMERYAAGYTGIIKMLKKSGAKLNFVWKDGKVNISVLPLTDYTLIDEISSAQKNLTVSKTYKACNHLICLGKGDLSERAVIHLFTDESGNIQPYSTKDTPLQDSDYILDESQKVISGKDEITIAYDYSSAEITTNYILLTSRPSNWNSNFKDYFTYDGESYKAVSGDSAPSWSSNTYYTAVQDRYAVLIEKAKEKLEEYWTKNNKCEFKFADEVSDYDINDIVGATEVITDTKVKSTITKKIIKTKQNETTIEYEVE